MTNWRGHVAARVEVASQNEVVLVDAWTSCAMDTRRICCTAVAGMDIERIRGALVGTALGDMAGLPFEGLRPDRVARGLARGWRTVRISDDTEQTILIASSLAESRDPRRFSDAVVRRLRRWFLAMPPAIGWGTLRACVRLCLGARTGVRSAGNAPAMRAAVLGVVADDLAELETLVRAATVPTHTDERAVDAARLVALAARAPTSLDELARRCRTAELRAAMTTVGDAATQDPAEVSQRMGWQHGVSAYCVHTVPAALWAARTATSPADAISRAVRLGGDTDTTAAIAGAVAGAVRPDLIDPAPLPPRLVAFLGELASAVAGGRRPPRRGHPLLAVPRNFFAGVAMLGLAMRARWL